MTEFNPLAGAILSSAVTQKQSADARQQQIRRAQLTRGNAATPTDTFEPHVESADELHETDERNKKGSGQRDPRKPKKPSEPEADELDHDHIDLCG